MTYIFEGLSMSRNAALLITLTLLGITPAHAISAKYAEQLDGVVAQISQQVMTSPALGDRYTRGFLTGRPRVFSLLIAPTYAITSPT